MIPLSCELQINARVCGIPCIVCVFDIEVVPPFRGPAHLADSDMDYYGYKSYEYKLYNLRGYPMSFLERKMTEKDKRELQLLIEREV